MQKVTGNFKSLNFANVKSSRLSLSMGRQRRDRDSSGWQQVSVFWQFLKEKWVSSLVASTEPLNLTCELELTVDGSVTVVVGDRHSISSYSILSAIFSAQIAYVRCCLFAFFGCSSNFELPFMRSFVVATGYSFQNACYWHEWYVVFVCLIGNLD